MFGRIRASPSQSPSPSLMSSALLLPSPVPSTVEWLEVERPPSKLLKDDSLSIYEETLMKLKQGSQRSPGMESEISQRPEGQMDIEATANVSGGILAVSDREICSGGSNCGNGAPVSDQGKRTGREVSIRSLFSSYANSQQKQGF